MRDDVAVFERKHVQGSPELLAGQDERCSQSESAPAGGELYTLREVTERQLIHQRQGMNPVGIALAVGDERREATIEDAPQIARERLESRRVRARAASLVRPLCRRR